MQVWNISQALILQAFWAMATIAILRELLRSPSYPASIAVIALRTILLTSPKWLSGAERPIKTVLLSRYACYLAIQNADPKKEIVAHGQTCFAIQARQQELADECIEEEQNHGYMGLYGGLKQEEIHRRKGLKKSQKILDHMGSTELAANLFRETQAGEKLRREEIKGKDAANRTHREVRAKVRQTIKELGGTMPEELPSKEEVMIKSAVEKPLQLSVQKRQNLLLISPEYIRKRPQRIYLNL